MKPNRRVFLKRFAKTGQFAIGAAVLGQITRGNARNGSPAKHHSRAAGAGKGLDARAYLETVLYTRREVDQWIAGDAFNLEKFDGTIGWIHQPGHTRNGVDGAVCEYSYESSGARRMTTFAHQTCRINTYGDSFTHCDQVSDGETWQERLASHLCEPVRNFGVSGHSMYQAYARMKREEAHTPAGYIILNIHGGGYWSSLSPWSAIGIPRSTTGDVYRRPTLPYVKVNPATADVVECPNVCSTPESLYNLCDLDWVHEHFKDEFCLQIILAQENIKRQTPAASYGAIRGLAQAYGIDSPIESAETLSAALNKISARAGAICNYRILEKFEGFAKAQNKKIFYLLSHTIDDVAGWLNGKPRFDQTLVNYFNRKGMPYVDDLESHQADFSRYKISAAEYLNQYYIGHYTPLGNFFQAFAIKNKMVELLVPKPRAYSA